MSNAFPKLLVGAVLFVLSTGNASAVEFFKVPKGPPVPNDLDFHLDQGICDDFHVRRLLRSVNIYGLDGGPIRVKAGCEVSPDDNHKQVLQFDFNGKNGTFGNVDTFEFPWIVLKDGKEHQDYIAANPTRNYAVIIESAYWTIDNEPYKNEQGERAYQWNDSTRVLLMRIPPIPEPATWAMLILGFGLVGSVLRRQRSAVTQS